MGIVSVTSASAGARLDRLPIARFHWRILALIGSGAFLDAFDIYLAAGVVAALRQAHFATLAQSALFVSATFVGMVIGAATSGYLGDRFGRRYSYQFNLALFGFASLAAAFAPDMTFLIACRFVMGIGLGAELVVAAGTLGEFLPPAHRGRWVSRLGLIVNSGLLFATIIGYLVIPHLGWRVMFAMAGAGAVLIWVLRKQMPESPRWLESVGRVEEADAVLCAIETEVAAEKGPLAPPEAGCAIAAAGGSFAALFASRLRGRLVTAVLTAVAVNVSLYGFVTWLPTFLVSRGSSITQSLGYTALMSFGSIAGALVAMALADRMSRRTLLMAAVVSIALFGFLYPNVRSDVALVATGFLLVSSTFLLVTLGMFAYIPELFPTAVRLRGTGIAGMSGRFASILTPYATVYLFEHVGLWAVSLMIALVLAALLVAVVRLKVETSGASLDELSGIAAESAMPDARLRTEVAAPAH